MLTNKNNCVSFIYFQQTLYPGNGGSGAETLGLGWEYTLDGYIYIYTQQLKSILHCYKLKDAAET